MDRAHTPQDPSRDAHGNSMEDIIAYAIVESMDPRTFHKILNEPALEDADERRQGYGPVQKEIYGFMETHFKQKRAHAGELQTLAAGTSAARRPHFAY